LNLLSNPINKPNHCISCLTNEFFVEFVAGSVNESHPFVIEEIKLAGIGMNGFEDEDGVTVGEGLLDLKGRKRERSERGS
jgi:hypothetical protein